MLNDVKIFSFLPQVRMSFRTPLIKLKNIIISRFRENGRRCWALTVIRRKSDTYKTNRHTSSASSVNGSSRIFKNTPIPDLLTIRSFTTGPVSIYKIVHHIENEINRTTHFIYPLYLVD